MTAAPTRYDAVTMLALDFLAMSSRHGAYLAELEAQKRAAAAAARARVEQQRAAHRRAYLAEWHRKRRARWLGVDQQPESRQGVTT